MIDLPAEICFVAAHPAAGEHFYFFSHELEKDGVPYYFLATEGAYDKAKLLGGNVKNFHLSDRKLQDLTNDELDQLADVVLKTCKLAKQVFVEGGSAFSERLLLKFKERAPQIKRVLYWDNPEPDVPGGYSEQFAKLAAYAETVVYSLNKPNIAEHFPDKEWIGLGFFPQAIVDKYRSIRSDPTKKAEARKKLFDEMNIPPDGSSLVIFFGGANNEYMEKAFPNFLNQTLHPLQNSPQFKSILFVLQQHARAKTDFNNKDAELLDEWKKTHPTLRFVVSKSNFDTAAVAADVVLYHQTSASLQFLLSGIPGMQVGFPYCDTPVRLKLYPSIPPESSELFIEKLCESLHKKPLNKNELQSVSELIGISPNWYDRFRTFVLY